MSLPCARTFPLLSQNRHSTLAQSAKDAFLKKYGEAERNLKKRAANERGKSRSDSRRRRSRSRDKPASAGRPKPADVARSGSGGKHIDHNEPETILDLQRDPRIQL